MLGILKTWWGKADLALLVDLLQVGCWARLPLEVLSSQQL